ncbi:hypothetical protein [Leuconostoc citreum]|uniref:hypothetical protein n=1 Tax=Leuconostoc citreum TaxID=33964 RepID=UPI00116D6A0E|nr:hypothetical protein [Leuconostoc citreum]KAF0261144.1 hypothetical protein CRI81_02895 [Leuconostoc citreum]GEK61914.1 hypothetical protein LCI01_15500 [Leuconostoc citreum]
MIDILTSNFTRLFISSSVVATLLSSLINYFCFRRKEKNSRRKELKIICDIYIKQGSKIHQECRERILNNDGTEMCNIINETRVRDFCRSIEDDMKLIELCAEFKVNKDKLDKFLNKYSNVEADQIYEFLRTVKEEFIEIRKKLSA